jgi:hypothetical protein
MLKLEETAVTMERHSKHISETTNVNSKMQKLLGLVMQSSVTPCPVTDTWHLVSDLHVLKKERIYFELKS